MEIELTDKDAVLSMAEENEKLLKENDHMRGRLELADRMACFIKNHRFHFKRPELEQDAKDLLDMYFGNTK